MDEDMKSRGQWFAVQTLSGQEKKARENIQRLIDMGEAAGIYEAVIPEERVSEVRNGKQFIRPRKLFPGYIFIRMDLYDPSTGIINEDAWYFVRNVKGIIGFIGGTNNPTPLAESEVRAIFRTEEARETVVPKIVYEVGETVSRASSARLRTLKVLSRKLTMSAGNSNSWFPSSDAQLLWNWSFGRSTVNFEFTVGT